MGDMKTKVATPESGTALGRTAMLAVSKVASLQRLPSSSWAAILKTANMAVLLSLTAFAAHAETPIAKTTEEVIARMKPFSGTVKKGVDPSTLTHKVMCGYQGWFGAEGDSSGQGWVHYDFQRMVNGEPGCRIDLWPDVSELGADEQFASPFKMVDGKPATVFSSQHPRTVLRHFQWMETAGIDGVFLQRFPAPSKSAKHFDFLNRVLDNVRNAANATGRIWALMYDLSGKRRGELESVVMEDFKLLFDKMQITKDPAYQRHNGKPVISVWGIGFNDKRDYTLEECERLIDFLKNDPVYGGNTVMIGVPYFWREAKRDATPDPRLHDVLAKADIISPWSVGRYHADKSLDNNLPATQSADVAWCREHKRDYMPVIFPGFSWRNQEHMNGREAKLNAIPRQGGAFLWKQAMMSLKSGSEMLYIAMFDEMDEGTAIFKCTNNPPLGAQGFATYEGLPSDHYLWLTGMIGKVLRKELPALDTMPERK